MKFFNQFYDKTLQDRLVVHISLCVTVYLWWVMYNLPAKILHYFLLIFRRMDMLVRQPFVRISYREAITALQVFFSLNRYYHHYHHHTFICSLIYVLASYLF